MAVPATDMRRDFLEPEGACVPLGNDPLLLAAAAWLLAVTRAGGLPVIHTCPVPALLVLAAAGRGTLRPGAPGRPSQGRPSQGRR